MNIVLDIGSGATLKNDTGVIKEMVDAIKDQDTGKHSIYIKTQLFEHLPPNQPLYYDMFEYLYYYGTGKGYPVTASVFDRHCLYDLLKHDPPFVKIACNLKYYYLVGEVPRKTWINVSVPFEDVDGLWKDWHMRVFCCVPKYPATIKEYEKRFNTTMGLDWHVSDHTVGLDLFHKYRPIWWEKHVCLKREKENPDSGEFALLVKELGEIL